MADMFYTWGVSGCPHICMPPVHLNAPCTFLCPQGCTHPPYAPILFYASVCFWRLCMLWWLLMGCLLCLDTLPYITPVWVPPLYYTPHTQSLVPCASVMFQGYQYVMWAFPFCQKGFGGIPHQLGVGGIST